jgi:hypothetical protein
MWFAFVFFLEVDNRDQKMNPTPHPKKKTHMIYYTTDAGRVGR